MLWLRGIKIYLDGGMLTGSAYMLQPWGVSKIYSITDPEYRGMLFIEAGRCTRSRARRSSNDLQFTAHTVGDGAVASPGRRLRGGEPRVPRRATSGPASRHSNFMSAARRSRRCSDWASWPTCSRPGSTSTARRFDKHFGDERLTYFQPYKTLFERGVMVGGGSDHMQKIGSLRSINPYNPFLGMWITLARQPRWTDQPLHPEQRITREQAIRLYTINNAYLTFEEKEKGSLETGKLADFIVLDKDILTCPVDEVKDIQVNETYLGGKQVYRRN